MNNFDVNSNDVDVKKKFMINNKDNQKDVTYEEIYQDIEHLSESSLDD